MVFLDLVFCWLVGFKGSIRLVFQDLALLVFQDLALVFLLDSMVFRGFFDALTIQRWPVMEPFHNLFDKGYQTFDFQ